VHLCSECNSADACTIPCEQHLPPRHNGLFNQCDLEGLDNTLHQPATHSHAMHPIAPQPCDNNSKHPMQCIQEGLDIMACRPIPCTACSATCTAVHAWPGVCPAAGPDLPLMTSFQTYIQAGQRPWRPPLLSVLDVIGARHFQGITRVYTSLNMLHTRHRCIGTNDQPCKVNIP